MWNITVVKSISPIYFQSNGTEMLGADSLHSRRNKFLVEFQINCEESAMVSLVTSLVTLLNLTFDYLHRLGDVHVTSKDAAVANYLNSF